MANFNNISLIKSQEFLDQKFKNSLRKMRDIKNFSQKKIWENAGFSAVLICTLIVLRYSFVNFLPSHHDNFSIFLENLEGHYVKWYDQRLTLLKLFLPSSNFFSHSLSFIRIFFLCIFAAIFYSIKPIFDNDLNRENLLIDFFEFYDKNLQYVTIQKLLYSEVINNNISLVNKRKLILEDNLTLNFDDHLVDVAQIKAIKKIPLTKSRKFFDKDSVDYRGFIISTEIAKKEGRSVKILVGKLKDLDLSLLSNYSFKTSIEDKIQIFSFQEKDLNFWEEQADLANYFKDIEKYIYSKKYNYDQLITDLFDNLADDKIKINNFLEITISEENLTIILSTGRRLLKHFSIFDQDSGINDCYFIMNIVEIFRKLINKTEITY